uniref:Uncharacterized protein AlNc14C6G889 n=1 Tax=Albugo laibachii Nc14 TaxID=890382 RepID=F0W1C0_9STRA|nr:conserved hypothetical protein [Albugo laibachii Nc14]|eukprot:CCA14848.1 conserved hypothetical protein [Albugo laibachii Nc14]
MLRVHSGAKASKYDTAALTDTKKIPKNSHLSGGILKVEVLNACNLLPAVLGSLLKWTPSYSNPYVSLSLSTETYLTTAKKQTLSPSWKEAGFLQVPLPTDQEIAQSLSPNSSSSLYHHSKIPNERSNTVAYHPCHPELLVRVYHRARMYDDINAGDHENTHEDKQIGQVLVPLLPCILSSSSSYRSWYTLRDDEHRDAGQIQIALHFDVTSMAPRRGDIVRVAGYGGMDYYAKLVPMCANLEIVSTFQDSVFVHWKSNEKWVVSFEVHRNLVVVVSRPSQLDTAHLELDPHLKFFLQSLAFFQLEDMWRSLPDSNRNSIRQTFLLCKIGASLVAHTARTTLNEVYLNGINAGLECCICGSREAADKIKEELIKTFYAWDSRQHLCVEGCNMAGDTLEATHKPTIVDAFTAEDSMKNREGLLASRRLREDKNKRRATEELAEDGNNKNGPGFQLTCPITGCLMVDPVVAADGHTYEREAILHWFSTSTISPMTGSHLSTLQVFSNFTLRRLLEEHQQKLADDTSSKNSHIFVRQNSV